MIQPFTLKHPGKHLSVKHSLSLSDGVPAHQPLFWSPPQHPSPPQAGVCQGEDKQTPGWQSLLLT